jgi:hypothetical protein
LRHRSYLKNADPVQVQEAHLNQYNQMCYPAYAGARADPPSLKSYGGTGEKAENTREYVSILRRSAIRQSILADNWALDVFLR